MENSGEKGILFKVPAQFLPKNYKDQYKKIKEGGCNTLFPPVCKNNYAGQELWQTQRCECVILNGP